MIRPNRTSLPLALALTLASACAPPPTLPPPAPTRAPAVTIVPVTPSATPVPKMLTVCMSQEPASLLWTESSPATTAVLEAINDGSIDTLSYGRQPVIFEKLPSQADGDAERARVTVPKGELVVDARTGQVVPLARGVTLAQPDGPPIEYDGRAGSAETVQLSASWTLVEGLTWHDGQPVTADDQVFMFETSRSPDLPTLKYLANRTASFAARDERTTTWTGLPGFDDPNYFLNVWSPLPRHAYGSLTPAQMLVDESVSRKPLGYGPFRIDAWLPGDRIELSAARGTYWRARDGLPRLDRLIFRFVPDPEQLGDMLLSGGCDLGTQDVPFETELARLRQYAADGRLTVHTTAAPIVEVLNFNAKPGAAYFGFAGRLKNANGTPIFSDPVTRQALAHCIDREALVDEALGGAAETLTAYLPPNHPLYPDDDTTLTRYPFDPAKGLELLRSRGWADHDGDGVLDRLGEKFSVTYLIRRTPARERVSEFVREQLLSHCQIEAVVEPHDTEFMIATSSGLIFGRRFDLSQLAWPVTSVPPCLLFVTDEIPDDRNDWGGANVAGFSNPGYDSACLAALTASDPAGAAEWHAQAMRIFTVQLPVLPLYARLKIAASVPGLQGFELDPTAGSDLWNVEHFDLPDG